MAAENTTRGPRLCRQQSMGVGWPLEQRKKKVDKTVPNSGRPEDTRVDELEEEIRKTGNQIVKEDRDKQYCRKGLRHNPLHHL